MQPGSSNPTIGIWIAASMGGVGAVALFFDQSGGTRPTSLIAAAGLVILMAAVLHMWHRQQSAIQAKSAELEGRLNERTRQLVEANTQLKGEVEQSKGAEHRLLHAATHDSLTGLPNRALLMDRLRQAVDRAQRHGEYGFAVMFMDVDNFKLINDSLGHDTGDLLLIDVANAIAASVRGLDSVTRVEESTTARLGGDEFVVLLDGVKDANDAARVASRIQERVSHAYQINNQQITVHLSIGITFYTGDGRSAEDLLRDADTAMYRAKLSGKDRYALFDPAMHAEAVARLQMENALRRAVPNNELVLEYQPLIDLATGRVTSLEALVRWHHPTLGVLKPDKFLSLAEESGLSTTIGAWVLRRAVLQARAWNANRSPADSIRVHVNVSKRELADGAYVNTVCQVLTSLDAPAQWLRLEITETAVMSSGARVNEVLTQLRGMGLELYLDDFGTGLSSLHCLKELPINAVKIDRAFIQGTPGVGVDVTVLRAIVDLAHHLNLSVIAEGVENDEQMSRIRACGVDIAQGRLLGSEMDGDAAGTILPPSNVRHAA